MLEMDKKHNVVITERYLEFDENGEKHFYCFINGHKRYIRPDLRGKKSKFWIQNKAKDRYAYLLKYEERKNDSMDNVGQFIMAGILDQLGVPHARYLVADFQKNGKPYDAIISESYKKSSSEVEISGFTLNSKNFDREYDNNLGEKPKQHHTVDFYMSVLKKLYEKNDVDFDGIRNQLLEYVLLQYIFVMSDLHYYNLSFSYDENIGHKSLKVVPFYDCGNICNLNLSKRKVKNIYEQISRTKKRSAFVDSFIHRKMPMFGIQTDLSDIHIEEGKTSYTCRPICEQAKNDKELDIMASAHLEILRSELAFEIMFNPELSQFYEKIKNDVNIKQVTDYFNSIKEGTIPYYCADLVQMTMESTIASLDKTITKQRKILCSGEKSIKIEDEMSAQENGNSDAKEVTK